MLIESKEILEQVFAEGLLKPTQTRPQQVLMVNPEYFRVEYAINPYMKSATGELNKVNEANAKAEWNQLFSIYKELGYMPAELSGEKGFPDMVFAANQSFPFLNGEGKESVLLSEMRSEFRKGEVQFFRNWYQKNGYKVYELENKKAFLEGNGDALIQYPYNLIWGGYGHRSSKNAYSEIIKRFPFYVVPLELDRAHHYHLDLCMSILNTDTVVIAPHAFSEESLAMIRLAFPKVIEVSEKENLQFACCNCHSPDGKHVITHKGAREFIAKIKDMDLIPIEVDTSEYLKSGGSVFCMKMMVF